MEMIIAPAMNTLLPSYPLFCFDGIMRQSRSNRQFKLAFSRRPRMLHQEAFLQHQPVSERRDLCEPVGLLQLRLPPRIWREKLRKR